jgi:hypothetical protein
VQTNRKTRWKQGVFLLQTVRISPFSTFGIAQRWSQNLPERLQSGRASDFAEMTTHYTLISSHEKKVGTRPSHSHRLLFRTTNPSHEIKASGVPAISAMPHPDTQGLLPPFSRLKMRIDR